MEVQPDYHNHDDERLWMIEQKEPCTRQAPPVCRFSWPKGTSLKPVPPIGQFKDVRSLDVRESDKIDEKQLATWIKQAASIPGWDGGSTRYGGSTVRARSGSDFLYYVKGTLEGNHGEVRWNP